MKMHRGAASHGSASLGENGNLDSFSLSGKPTCSQENWHLLNREWQTQLMVFMPQNQRCSALQITSVTGIQDVWLQPFALLPINQWMSHCYRAITLIKQYQAEKAICWLELLFIGNIKKLLKPRNSFQINGWHRNTSTYFRANVLYKPESLRVYLRFYLLGKQAVST